VGPPAAQSVPSPASEVPAHVITIDDLEVRAGVRTLLQFDGSSLRVQPGDRIGLVGRNGARKTTTMGILAGEGRPHEGTVTREGNMDQLARSRVLSAKGLDVLMADMAEAQTVMAEAADDDVLDRAVKRYGRLEDEFSALGGYEAESEAARICHSLGLEDRILT